MIRVAQPFLDMVWLYIIIYIGEIAYWLDSFDAAASEDIDEAQGQRDAAHDGEDVERSVLRHMSKRFQPDRVRHLQSACGINTN
jgi:hypothetical protein